MLPNLRFIVYWLLQVQVRNFESLLFVIRYYKFIKILVTFIGQRGYFTCYSINRGYNWSVITDTTSYKNTEPNCLILYEVHEPPLPPPAQVAQQSNSGFSMFKYFRSEERR